MCAEETGQYCGWVPREAPCDGPRPDRETFGFHDPRAGNPGHCLPGGREEYGDKGGEEGFCKRKQFLKLPFFPIRSSLGNSYFVLISSSVSDEGREAETCYAINFNILVTLMF